MKKFLSIILLVSLTLLAIKAETETDTVSLSAEEIQEQLAAMVAMDSIEKTFNYQYGEVTLGKGLAKLNVPENFKYLNSEQSEYVLTDIWGNPPSESLGLLLPKEAGIFSSNSYAINITYDEIGFVEDDDAKDLDYDDLLSEMKSDAKAANDYRKENGYPEIELVGWASQPFYDAESKKIHWAKELKFDDSPDNTLNYAIRFLGRKGVLEMNFISEMTALPTVKNDIPTILPSVNFNKGYRYGDFDASLDKVAAVGIGGLIAGKVLAKTGFFVLIAKFWKVLVVAVMALFGFIGKIFRGKEA